MDIGCGTAPGHDLAVLVDQQTPFAADDPALIGQAFFAELSWVAAFTNRMEPFDAVAVRDAQDCTIRTTTNLLFSMALSQ